MRMLFDHLGGSSVVSFGLTASSKATVLLLTAALAVLALRRYSAATRHLVWTTALLGALALPIVSLFIPSWPLTVSLPPALSLPEPAEATPPPNTASRSGLDRSPSKWVVPDSKNKASAPVAPGEAAPGERWGPLVIVWASGAAVSLLPLVVGLLNLVLIARRTSSVTEPEWTELVRTLSDRLGLRRRVRLVKSSGSTMPMTWGWLRPVVLLPLDSERWPTERRRVVLLHERYRC